MEEHKHVKNEFIFTRERHYEGRGQCDISCSLEDKRKVVISRQCMVISPFEETGMDELPQTGKLNLKYFIGAIILVFNIASLYFMY